MRLSTCTTPRLQTQAAPRSPDQHLVLQNLANRSFLPAPISLQGQGKGMRLSDSAHKAHASPHLLQLPLLFLRLLHQPGNLNNIKFIGKKTDPCAPTFSRRRS